MLTIHQAGIPEQVTIAQELMREYLTWVIGLEPDADQVPTFHEWEEELATLPGIYAPPKGRLFFAMFDDQPAGIVALKPVEEKIGELKRFYVRPTFRGHKIGAQLVKALLEEAHAIGYQRVILDSHIPMKAAHKIYAEVGFKFVDAPAGFPEEIKSEVVFMECDL